MTALCIDTNFKVYIVVYAALTALGVHDSEVTMTSLYTIVSPQHYILYRHCHNRSIVLYCSVLSSSQNSLGSKQQERTVHYCHNLVW